MSSALDSRSRRPPIPWLPGGRRGLAAVAYDGKIYAIGGETVDGVSADVLRFDPLKNSWQALAPKPLAVSDIQAAMMDEIIYVPGGRLASGEATDALEVYDPRHDAWTQKAHLPQPVSGYALVAFEGRLYLFGGQNGKNYLNTVYEYNPNLDTWSQRTSMLTRRAFMGAAAVTGKIYVIGGFDGQNPLVDNEVYFPTRDGHSETAWEKGRPLPEGRYGMGLAGLADGLHQGLNRLRCITVGNDPADGFNSDFSSGTSLLTNTK